MIADLDGERARRSPNLLRNGLLPTLCTANRTTSGERRRRSPDCSALPPVGAFEHRDMEREAYTWVLSQMHRAAGCTWLGIGLAVDVNTRLPFAIVARAPQREPGSDQPRP
jgi:hypothetical protein